MPSPPSAALAGVGGGAVLPVERNGSAERRANAHQHLGELGLAVAADPGDAVDLALLDGQRDPRERRHAVVARRREVRDFEPHPAAAASGGHRAARRRAHHQLRHASVVERLRVLVGDRPSGPHDGDPIGEIAHLAQFVGYQDDRRAAPREAADHGQQTVRLVVGQHRGRLVEDQNAGARHQHLDDLDPLPLRDRDRIDAGSGVELEAEFTAIAFDGLGRPRQLVGPAPAEPVRHRHVLGDRERAHQLEVLVHHADTERAGMRRAVDRDRNAVDGDPARIRGVEPADHVHQRGLAGAVLAQQGVDPSVLGAEPRLVERPVAVELLADVAHLERDGHRGRSDNSRPAGGCRPGANDPAGIRLRAGR